MGLLTGVGAGVGTGVGRGVGEGVGALPVSGVGAFAKQSNQHKGRCIVHMYPHKCVACVAMKLTGVVGAGVGDSVGDCKVQSNHRISQCMHAGCLD